MRAGDRISGPLVDVISVSSQRPRVGVIVPRYGHSAVARNRVRRRLKELARREWLPVAVSTESARDVILRAKPAAYGASYARLKETLVAPFGRLCER
jgi:ribonuclease P protein component